MNAIFQYTDSKWHIADWIGFQTGIGQEPQAILRCKLADKPAGFYE